jgi:hypothetical protein
MKRREFLASTAGAMIAAKLARAAAPPCPPPTVQATGGGTASTTCPIPPPNANPKWLSGAAVNQWVALQSPSVANVAPNPSPPGNSGVGAVTDAWCGAALRKTGSYFILHGGGHADYAGNEIYGLSLEADSPVWQRVWGPTPNSQIVENSYYYADGNPAPIHTYGRLQYDDQRDVLMRFGNGQYPVGGVGPGVDGWQWGSSKWFPQGTFQFHPSTGQTFYEGMGYTKDPSGNVYGVNSLVRYVWRHATQTFDTPPISNRSTDCGQNSMAYDTTRGCCWSIQPTTPGKILRWDVSSSGMPETLMSLTGAAAADIQDAYMGLQYDPIADRLFIFRQSGTLYSVNPATLTVTPVVPVGSVLPTATSGSGLGTNNKLQYVPNLGGLVLITQWVAPVLFIKTH